MSIQQLFEENSRFIEAYAAQAMAEMNARADEIINSMALDHYARMDELDSDFKAWQQSQCLQSEIAPFGTVVAWFDHQPDDVQAEWRERYYDFMYGPNADDVVHEDDVLGLEVMSLLKQRDVHFN